VNWQTIGKYAIALFVAQALIGFLEGFLLPSSVAVLFGSAAVSFVVCAAIFTHLGAYQSRKPFPHAWLALLLEVAAASVLGLILPFWISSQPFPLIVLELVVLVCALVAGTLFGISLRHRTRRTADA
jgi:hypothetical protein